MIGILNFWALENTYKKKAGGKIKTFEPRKPNEDNIKIYI